VAIVSIFLTYAIQQLIEAKGRPVLVKEVIQTDLSSLSADVQRQILLVPVTYTLRHSAGAAAQNVTISIKTDTIVSIADLKFSSESEDHQCSSPDPHTIKVNVPIIRPGGLVNMQLLTTATNQIKFSELSSNAQFTTTKGGVEVQQKKQTFLKYTLFGVGAVIWLTVIFTIIYIILRTKKSWQEMETNTTAPEIKKPLIILIVAIYIYNLILNSFGVLGPWLPAPRISFDDLISAFLFYLLITRYKLIEKWISAKIERLERDK
jgi:hypothetical protein